MRTKNEIDAERYFADALASIKTVANPEDRRPEYQYVTTYEGLWPQLWREYIRQSDEVHAWHRDLAAEAITRCESAETTEQIEGLLLTHVFAFLERYMHNFGTHRSHLTDCVAAYLWAVMERKIEWQDYGSRTKATRMWKQGKHQKSENPTGLRRILYRKQWMEDERRQRAQTSD